MSDRLSWSSNNSLLPAFRMIALTYINLMVIVMLSTFVWVTVSEWLRIYHNFFLFYFRWFSCNFQLSICAQPRLLPGGLAPGCLIRCRRRTCLRHICENPMPFVTLTNSAGPCFMEFLCECGSIWMLCHYFTCCVRCVGKLMIHFMRTFWKTNSFRSKML